MEESLCASTTPREWLEHMCWHIRNTAKVGNDNNTAVAVFVD